MTIATEIQRLHELHQQGILSEDESAQAKAALLSGAAQPANRFDEPLIRDANYVREQTKQWAVLLHVSQFAGYLVPLAGWIVPIVIWQLKKDELPEIDLHGRIVANWIISQLIYGVCFLLLVFVAVGIPLLVVLGILGTVFPIIAAVKASSGEIWEYPLSISFV